MESVYNHTKAMMDKSIEAMKKEFGTLRSGKVSVAILDPIRINYYDTPTNSTYEFTINYTKSNEEITTPDLTNSINSNDMTLDDTMEIMSKLQENKKLEKFITDLGLIES